MEKMMIPDNYKPIRQVGNGKTVSFSFDFPMLSENFIKVYREQDGVQELVDPSEYVWGYIPVEGEDAPVEDIAPENVITFYEAPADGVVVVIAREIPLEQTTPYKTSSGFPAVRVEDNFDKLTAITQQLTETLERCVKVEITDDQDPQDLIDDVFEKLDTATEVGEQAIKTAQETQELVEGSKVLIQEETQKAIEQLGSSSDEIINKARIWAEGEQAEVKELGGELSSMGAAGLAYAIANAPEDTPIDASGLKILNVIKGEKGEKGDKGDSFDAKGFLNIIYPVGSLFASSTDSCPVADYGVGIWEIVGTSLVTGSEAAVRGNGMTLGLTDGTNNYGVAGSKSNGLFPSSNGYGTNAGDESIDVTNIGQKTLGVTTDPEKSGIVANLPAITVNIFRRIA